MLEPDLGHEQGAIVTAWNCSFSQYKQNHMHSWKNF